MAGLLLSNHTTSRESLASCLGNCVPSVESTAEILPAEAERPAGRKARADYRKKTLTALFLFLFGATLFAQACAMFAWALPSRIQLWGARRSRIVRPGFFLWTRRSFL